MTIADLAVLAAVTAVPFAVRRFAERSRKKRGSGCSGGCSCGYCSGNCNSCSRAENGAHIRAKTRKGESGR